MHAVVPWAEKLKKLKTLIDTTEVTDWENKFLKSTVPLGESWIATKRDVRFTDKQEEVLRDLLLKHFGVS